MLRSLPPISMGMPLENRSNSPLPPIGQDISRPSSTSTQASTIRRHPQPVPQGPPMSSHPAGVSLPGVSSLAAPAPRDQSPQPRTFNPVNQHSPNYPTASPSAASIAGQGNNPPVCQNCQTSTTPLWRRDEMGSVLCNACGLFLKLHGRPRPISLKTDVIKSRNRVKNSGQALKKAAKALVNGQQSHMTPEPSARRVSHRTGSDRSNSPVSRAMTPSIPPPTMMDPIHFPPHHLTHSPSLPALHNFRQHSPSVASNAPSAAADRQSEAPTTWEGLQNENGVLKTRVSELEVINGLFKGRIQELERAENANRSALDQSRARELELTKRLGDLERQVTELRRQTPPVSAPSSGIKRPAEESTHFPTPSELSPPYAKRSRLSDVFEGSQSRPVSA